jgi:hypothetical protein
MSTDPNVYFLHGEEGSYGGQNYVKADALSVDGQWHTLAVDLVAIEPLESTHHLAVKVLVAQGPNAKLTVESIRFADQLPEGARVAPVPPRPPLQSATVDWRNVGRVSNPSYGRDGRVGNPSYLTAMAGWTQSPAADFAAKRDGSAMTFTVRGKGKCMRWLLTMPEPIDLGRLRHLTVRYKASGQLAPTTYAVWLGGKRSGATQDACISLLAGDLKTDGAWHNLSLTPSGTFAAVELAIGLDCAGDEADMTLDTIHFSSRPRRWNLAQVLDYKPWDEPWPAGQEGFVAVPVTIAGGRPSPFLAQRLDLADWFKTERVIVGGVPFVVERDVGRIPQSPMGEFGVLSLELPAGVREVCLLTAAAAPPTEPWGIDWKNPRPQEVLDVPEKVFYEIRYETGPPERVLPLDAVTGKWGMKRGLSVNVVHPDPARHATTLVLHDRMQTASFAILGATMRTQAPRIAEPNWDRLSSGITPSRASAVIPLARPGHTGEATVTAGGLQVRFGTQKGLTWSQLAAPGPPEQLACAPDPVFQVTVAGRVLPNDDWTCEKTEQLGAGRRFLLRHRAARLAATVECVASEGNQLLLRMTLANEGKIPTTATLHFPVLRGLRMGIVADTWYLCGKRGGIINAANAAFREPLGERHPLQMDGFFNPATGLALACLTHDTVAQHHFINMAKTGRGGEWSVEYVDRDLAPGATFAATEAALVLRAGDWRAIFAAYTDWLRTWFKPVAPRKSWFEKSFAMASGSSYYDGSSTPAERGRLQPQVDMMLKHIGQCDYLHLFGWGASKTYGDWGDYDHYDELGGLEYFRRNIQAVQQKGIAVSLYLDGYLNCQQGRSIGAHAKAWAMKRPDGSPQYVEEYKAYNECPSMNGWQDYLSQTYRRVRGELGSKVLYIDEYGATDGRWLCQAKDHGHNGYEIPYAGEVAMLQRIRAAVGPEMVLYTEYPPAEVSRRYLDGSITYQALWSADDEPLAPHFIDLARFAFPDFKQLHIIYYVINRAGNWWLLKYPFFNGEVYRIGVPNLPGMDEPSLAFLRRAVQIQCAHREAFASHDVRPLVPTEVAGVFANEFAGPKETVWTLYNANGRSVSRPVLRVRHVHGARYEDAWNEKPLMPEIKDGHAVVALELDPKGIGCLVQRP